MPLQTVVAGRYGFYYTLVSAGGLCGLEGRAVTFKLTDLGFKPRLSECIFSVQEC